MSAVDYYDVQSMIRDARSEIRGEIANAVREVREQAWVELANLQREIDSLHRIMDERPANRV